MTMRYIEEHARRKREQERQASAERVAEVRRRRRTISISLVLAIAILGVMMLAVLPRHFRAQASASDEATAAYLADVVDDGVLHAESTIDARALFSASPDRDLLGQIADAVTPSDDKRFQQTGMALGIRYSATGEDGNPADGYAEAALFDPDGESLYYVALVDIGSDVPQDSSVIVGFTLAGEPFGEEDGLLYDAGCDVAYVPKDGRVATLAQAPVSSPDGTDGIGEELVGETENPDGTQAPVADGLVAEADTGSFEEGTVLVESDGVPQTEGMQQAATPSALRVEASPEVTLSFKDDIVYQAVLNAPEIKKNVLGSDASARTIRISQDTLNSVTRLSISSYSNRPQAQATDISGIEAFKSLTDLSIALALDEHEQRSIEPLRGLTNLTSLTLCGSYWTSKKALVDLSPVSGLHKLKTLDVYDLTIPTVEPLRNLTALTTLRLSRDSCRVFTSISKDGFKDITPLRGLTGLQRLTIMDYDIGDDAANAATLALFKSLTYLNMRGNISDSDFVQICKLTNLTELWLGDLNAASNNVSDLSPIRSLTKMKTLYLGYNKITDISPLSALTSLETLDLRGNKVTDLAPLSRLTSLRVLKFGRDNYDPAQPLDTLEPLRGLVNITELALAECDVTDISPLAGMTRLRELDLNQNRISDISALSGKENLWDVQLDDNLLDEKDVQILTKLPKLSYAGVGHNNIADLTMFESKTGLRISAPSQGITVNAKRGDTIALPMIFRQSQDPNSRFFHHRTDDKGTVYDDTIQCEGCHLTADGTKVVVDADAGEAAYAYLVKKGRPKNATWTNAPLAYSQLEILLSGAAPKVTSYTVTYDPAGGTMETVTQTKKAGTSLTLLTEVPKKTSGFQSYLVGLNANGGQFEDGMDSASLTVNQGFTIDFVKWKGSDGRSYSPGQTYSADADLTLVAEWKETPVPSDAVPSVWKQGYRLLGFYTEAEGGTRICGIGDVPDVQAATTLYAHWEENPVDEYVLTYDANGIGLIDGDRESVTRKVTSGTYEVDDIKISSAKDGKETRKVSLDACGGTLADGQDAIEVSTDVSYAFGGWNTKADGTGKAYARGDAIAVSTDITLYAAWDKSEKSSMPGLPSPTRQGYSFAGWYDAEREGTLVGQAGDMPVDYDGTTLYAHWEPLAVAQAAAAPQATEPTKAAEMPRKAALAQTGDAIVPVAVLAIVACVGALVVLVRKRQQ